MALCQIPSALSDEEKFLQQKYLKLKKKKKLLQQQKIPKPENTPVNIQTQLKRSIDGGPKQDPKEVAKKLLKSGAISAIKPPEKEKQSFKRSKNSQRKKLEQIDKPKYQPFSAVYKNDNLDSEVGLKSGFEAGVSSKEKEAFAREETFREKRRDGKAHYVNRDIPNVGNTIYVHGIGINEQFLKMGFTQFGNIINLSHEFNKNCGFITYETIDQANKAIDSMNGTQFNNIFLKVSLARKQPFINKIQNLSANTSEPELSNTTAPISQAAIETDWCALATSYDEKPSRNKEKRVLISFEDIF